MTRLLTAMLCLSVTMAANASEMPSPTVPDGLGANIHFVGEPARDLDMLHAGGFRFVRMDLSWSTVEKGKGVYDFSEYDKLIDGLSKRGMRALLILCYSNLLYETNWMSVRTEEGRRAFTSFAAVAAERYRGKKVIWEIWNEPNIIFWRPQPSLDDYLALARSVIPAIRKADPEAVCIGPATSMVDLSFLESCFKGGFLKLVDAISVHPYRSSIPETAAPEILALKTLIARYSPDRPDIPIVSGEWGYTTVWPHMTTYSGVDEKLQGDYLPRQLLSNLSLGIPLSIWYDWRDDGTDLMDREHHFGTVDFAYRPKPSYVNMKGMTEALNGKRFLKRLSSGPDDHLLLFAGEGKHTVAAWTVAQPHVVKLSTRTSVNLTTEPQYFPVSDDDEELLAQSALCVTPGAAAILGGVSPSHRFGPRFEVQVRNPFDHRVRVRLEPAVSSDITGRYSDPTEFVLGAGEQRTVEWRGCTFRRDRAVQSVRVSARIGRHDSSQTVDFGLMNPISLGAQMQMDGTLMAVVGNPHLSRLRGELRVESNGTTVLARPVDSRKGRIEAPIDRQTGGSDDGLRLTLWDGANLLADCGKLRLVPVRIASDDVTCVVEGDPNVPGSCSVTEVGDPDARGKALAIAFDYGHGWKFARISPREQLDLAGRPHAIGIWVRGDGSGLTLRMRFVDAKGRVFQPVFGAVSFRGWRYLTAALDDPGAENWGGEKDLPRISYPIRLDTYIVVDGSFTQMKGSIDIAGPCLIYRETE